MVVDPACQFSVTCSSVSVRGVWAFGAVAVGQQPQLHARERQSFPPGASADQLSTIQRLDRHGGADHRQGCRGRPTAMQTIAGHSAQVARTNFGESSSCYGVWSQARTCSPWLAPSISTPNGPIASSRGDPPHWPDTLMQLWQLRRRPCLHQRQGALARGSQERGRHALGKCNAPLLHPSDGAIKAQR